MRIATRYSFLACVGVLLLAQSMIAHAQVSIPGITFNPATIPTGGTSQMTIALGNAGAQAANLTLPLTDVLPPGMTVVSIGAGTCSTTQVTAGNGGTSITYAGEAQIPVGGCTIVANVTATATSATTYFTNTIAA